jgi:hypothetical protein
MGLFLDQLLKGDFFTMVKSEALKRKMAVAFNDPCSYHSDEVQE